MRVAVLLNFLPRNIDERRKNIENDLEDIQGHLQKSVTLQKSIFDVVRSVFGTVNDDTITVDKFVKGIQAQGAVGRVAKETLEIA